MAEDTVDRNIVFEPPMTNTDTHNYAQDRAIIDDVSSLVSLGGVRFGHTGDLQKGGQNGLGSRVMSLDGATPQPFPPAIVAVIHEPTMWDNGYVTLQRQHKSLWEQHAKTIDGIDFGYQIDEHTLPYGHDGQQYSMPMKTKRTAVSPSISLDEVLGNLAWNIHFMYSRHICHPDTCASVLSAINDDGIPPWVWSTFTFSICVIQPDATALYNRIVDAYVITNMWPSETGNIGVKKELGSTTVPQRTFPHKGIVTHNENTRELGRLIFAAMNIHKVNYDYATTYRGLDGKLTGMGIEGTVAEALQDFGLLGGGIGNIATNNSEVNDLASSAMEAFILDAQMQNGTNVNKRVQDEIEKAQEEGKKMAAKKPASNNAFTNSYLQNAT